MDFYGVLTRSASAEGWESRWEFVYSAPSLSDCLHTSHTVLPPTSLFLNFPHLLDRCRGMQEVRASAWGMHYYIHHVSQPFRILSSGFTLKLTKDKQIVEFQGVLLKTWGNANLRHTRKCQVGLKNFSLKNPLLV